MDWYDGTPQIFLLSFLDKTNGYNLLSSLEGDFTINTIHISRPYFTGANWRFGCVPSATFSCSLQNYDKRFVGFPYGKAEAYAGLFDSETDSPYAGEIATINGKQIEINQNFDNVDVDGVAIPDTKNTQTVFVYFKNGEGVNYYIYLIDDNDKVRQIALADLSDDTVLGDPCDYFTKACSVTGGKIIYLYTDIDKVGLHTYTVYYRSKITVYDLIPVGVFTIEQPRSSSTNTIDILDAYDPMRDLDLDCGSFVEDIQTRYGNNCSADEFIDAILGDAFGIYYNSGVDPNIRVPLNKFTRKDYSFRELLSFACEAAMCNAYYDGAGVLLILPVSTYESDVEDNTGYQVPKTRIVADGYDAADYYTCQANGVVLFQTDGEVFKFGSTYLEIGNYVIRDNPLFDVQYYWNSDFLTQVVHFAQYHPMIIDLTEFNPAVEPRRAVTVQNIYTDQYQTAPIWQLDIYWNGKTSATITCGGEKVRADE